MLRFEKSINAYLDQGKVNVEEEPSLSPFWSSLLTVLPVVEKAMLPETTVTTRGDDKVSQFHHAVSFRSQVPRSLH